MNKSELNRAIAVELGWTDIIDSVAAGVRVLAVPPGVTDSSSLALKPLPDYAGDMNATMAVIRELWPGGVVEFKIHANWAGIDDSPMGACVGWSVEGEDDAERLARALLQALKVRVTA
jgi:hypothetical protein